MHGCRGAAPAPSWRASLVQGSRVGPAHPSGPGLQGFLPSLHCAQHCRRQFCVGRSLRDRVGVLSISAWHQAAALLPLRSATVRPVHPLRPSSLFTAAGPCPLTPRPCTFLQLLWNSLEPPDRIALLQVSWELHTDLKPLILLQAIRHGIR